MDKKSCRHDSVMCDFNAGIGVKSTSDNMKSEGPVE